MAITPQKNQADYLPDTVKSFPFKNKPLLSGILTFIILTGLIGLLVYQRLLIKKENEKNVTIHVLNAAKERLQESLAQSISAAKTLSFFIQQDGSVNNFELNASLILAANPQVDVLQLVPDGVIRYVYPLKGNEIVLGYNILEDTLRNKEALKAIKKREVFFAGPLQLKQGGVGIIGRLPVYRQNKFWGFSAVIVKMNTLLKTAGIDSAEHGGYYFQLSKINPDTHKEEFFIANPKAMAKKRATSINISTGDWKLSAVSVNTHSDFEDIIWLAILGIIISVIGGAFVFIIVKRPGKLDELVRIRTAELNESEERYRSLIEQASDGIIVYSFDGKIHQFNNSAYKEMGYSREEFAKLNLKDLLAEKRMAIQQSEVDALQSGKTAIMERKLIKKDGSFMDIEINVSMLSDTTLLAFVRNITNRKNAEKALKESERKFSGVFQSHLIGLAIYDDDYCISDVNKSFASMLETTREELLGRDTKDTGIPLNVNIKRRQDALGPIIKILKEKTRLKNYETEIKKQNGSSITLMVSVEPMQLNNQRNWLITAIDITKKREAEVSLIQSEIKYRSLIEQASDGIIISDFNGIIKEVNKSICEMGGYTMNEMVGKFIDNFMPKADITENPLRINDLIEGKTLRYERRMLKKDGSIIDVEINSKMALGNTLIGFVKDITERKRAVLELQKSNERFELIALATNDAIWDHDFVTNITSGNHNLYNLYGFKKGIDSINFEIFIEKVHPEEREKLLNNLKKAVKKRAIFINEDFHFKISDGTYKNIFDRAYIKYDEEGNPLRMIGVMQDITDRVKGEAAIIKEKELSDSIINSLPAVFYLYNKEGKFLRWNKNFESVTGFSNEEMKHKHPLDFFEGEEKELLIEKIGNVFITGHDTVEANFVTKDKRKLPYYFSGMRIEYEGEDCLLGFGLDFSTKVKADKIVKESEQKFRSLVEQASDGVAILSAQGTPIYISPSVERILGYTEAESLELNLFELTHPDDVEKVAKVFEQVLQNPGVPVKGATSRLLHKDGTWRWLEDTITNMLHVPSINGIVENFRDVTDQLEIEKKIIAEKDLSDAVINSLPGIFYLYDEKGRFIRWNKNFETVTGYSSHEIRNMHPLDFFDEDAKSLVGDRIQKVFKTKIPGEEFFLLTKDKVKIPFYFNSLAIEYDGLPYLAGMGFDVTERKKIEHELLISNQNLQVKASELTSSYKELERFAYVVSHDLQEPLRMVSSFLKLFEKKYKGNLDEAGEKYIHFAVDGADRMRQLIMDLLEYSRTGTNKDAATDTNMNDTVHDVLRILKPTIDEEDAIVNVAELPVLFNTNKLQMFQLMQNLVGNALKYHSKNKPVINIKAVEEAAQWLFSISDNGIGIDPKFSETIFIIFQRLHNKNEFSGTGIGLTICKKIVEKHGGKIWVQSAPGEGSTFYFTISKKL